MLLNDKDSIDRIRQKNPYIKKIIATVTGKHKIDVTLIEELESMMDASRSIKDSSKELRISLPYGYGGKRDLLKLSKCYARTQAFKSRTRFILLTFSNLKRSLSKLKKQGVEHLWSVEGAKISLLKPVAKQDAFFSLIFKEIDEMIDEVEHVEENAQLVLDNLQDTYWAVQGVAEILKDFHKDEILSTRKKV